MLLENKSILLTTPEYPPSKPGGIATLSKAVVDALRANGADVEVGLWTKPKQITRLVKPYHTNLIHSHYWPTVWLSKEDRARSINLIHGAELLTYSKNIATKLLKNLTKPYVNKCIEQAKANIFISQFSFETACRLGLKANYERDIIFPNRIDLSDIHRPVIKPLDGVDEIRLCCFARDVPHKNIKGTIRFAEILSKVANKKVTLRLGPGDYSSEIIKINCKIVRDDQRDDIYRGSHFNLIFSLDQSERGNFEGFGLTPLEAARFGTPSVGLRQAGLIESIHDGKTGWLLDSIDDQSIESWWSLAKAQYEDISQNSYDHTVSNHNSKDYASLFAGLLS